jgi:hypothetical protein
MFRVRLKSIKPKWNTCGEGSFPSKDWRWETKVWIENRIRYPGIPHCQRWMAIFSYYTDFEVNSDNHSALWVYLQKWKQKKLVGPKANEVKYVI